ncbi:MAG TPA: hypothetical protein PKA64_18095, partial [Myxococcota bacterium]|nr:hypothetical protein [Myxococcota bacterium]
MADLFSYDDLHTYDLSTQAAILDDIAAAATALGDRDVLDLCERARDRLAATLALREEHWVGRTPSPDRQQARSYDREADQHVSRVHRILKDAADDPTHPSRVDAAAVRHLCFPRGLGPHINAPYEEQILLNAALVQHLRAPEREALVAALFLVPSIDRIDALTTALDRALSAEVVVPSADVRASERACGELVRQVVYRVLGKYDPLDAEQVARRERLLA